MKRTYTEELLGRSSKGKKGNQMSDRLRDYSQLSEQYTGLATQPSAFDSIGDNFFALGSGPANGPQQRETNALLSGIGAGVKSYGNMKKQRELEPLYEQTAALEKAAADIMAQTQEAQMDSMRKTQFFRQNSSTIREIAKANLAGDTDAGNKLGANLLQRWKQIANDPSIGDFSHQLGGDIFYVDNESGMKHGVPIVDVMFQSGIDPQELFGPDTQGILAGLSPGAKQDYENRQAMDRMAMQEQGLRNQAMQSDIDYRNAQMNAMAQQQNQRPYDKNAVKRNEDYLSKQVPEFETNEAFVDSLTQLEKVITEAQSEGLAGSSAYARLAREYQQATGKNRLGDLSEMFRAVYFDRVKQAGGSNPSTLEFENVMKTIPSIERNPEAALFALNRDKEQALKKVFKFSKTLNYLHDTQMQGSPYDREAMAEREGEYEEFKSKYMKSTPPSPPGGSPQGPQQQAPGQPVNWSNLGTKIGGGTGIQEQAQEQPTDWSTLRQRE